MTETRAHAQAIEPNAADSLGRSLASIGVAGRVEAHDRLAVLVSSDPSMWNDAQVRRRALALAREHGFTNLALEIGDDTATRATLPRD